MQPVSAWPEWKSQSETANSKLNGKGRVAMGRRAAVTLARWQQWPSVVVRNFDGDVCGSELGETNSTLGQKQPCWPPLFPTPVHGLFGSQLGWSVVSRVTLNNLVMPRICGLPLRVKVPLVLVLCRDH
ncbi:hypothetical protein BaRGS_00009334 [Batillaria attramentaria]|uniref:Uncharacterized protein n=1 Tax=Batillaria attramentaria TaxID=370345 RepID=A0ABD0LK84_9CAEN